MTWRQRLEAAYFRARTLLLRDSNTEAYLLVRQRDMSGRVTTVPAIASLDLPIDWRSMQRARQESFVVWGVCLLLWTLVAQSLLVGAMHLDAAWWLPGSFIPALFHTTAWWNSMPWPVLVVWVAGLFVVDAITRTVCVYRACDRSGLSVEHGSARLALPEDLASDKIGDNLFPPGYDLYGGFHPSEALNRLVNVEHLTLQKDRMSQQSLKASGTDIPVGAPALLDGKERTPAKRSRVQEILDR